MSMMWLVADLDSNESQRLTGWEASIH